MTLPQAAKQVWRSARQQLPQTTYEAIIIAGARVQADGSACPALVRRVQRGVDLWRAGIAPVIVMTGRGPGPVAEAEVMANLARALGVPSEALILEIDSMTTVENAACCRKKLGCQRIVVVSCPAHLRRCEVLFGRHFAEVRGAPSAWGGYRSSARMLLREAVINAWWG